MAEEFRVLRPNEYHTHLVSKGQRADGRTLEEVRDIKLETDAIKTADSSSLVKLGNTSLVCGCTYKIVKLNDKTEDDREAIKINLELPPICSTNTPLFTNKTALLMTRKLKDIIEDSECLKDNNLSVQELGLCICLNIEVICLNYDGCLLDAALIAILSALSTLKISDQSLQVVERGIALKTIPICSTFAMIGGQLICDPTVEEETIAQSTFTIAIDTTTGLPCHISKTGGQSISSKQLLDCTRLAKSRACKFGQVLGIPIQVKKEEKSMDVD